MQEGILFTVDVGHEVLRAFGQLEDGLQLDDLGGGRLHGGVLGGKQPQVTQPLGRKLNFVVHFNLFSRKWVKLLCK